MGRGYQRGNLEVHREKASWEPQTLPFPQLKQAPARPAEESRGGTELASCTTARQVGRRREGSARVRVVPGEQGNLTLLIWSWVFLILWSSGVSATTLKPLPLFFSNSSL